MHRIQMEVNEQKRKKHIVFFSFIFDSIHKNRRQLDQINGSPDCWAMDRLKLVGCLTSPARSLSWTITQQSIYFDACFYLFQFQ